MIGPGFGKVHMARPVMNKRPCILYRDARRRAIPRDILVDMVVGTIVFSVLYDVAKTIFRNKNSVIPEADAEHKIETVEAIVIQEDSDDEIPFKGQRIIIDILDNSDDENEANHEEDASNMTMDAEIIQRDDVDNRKELS
jgi:hypothetical protein